MKTIYSAIFLITVCCIFAYADVPPESGNAYVTEALKIEAEEDMPDYRFYLQTPMDLVEIEVTKAKPYVRESGGGGALSHVTLLAIPKKSLAGFEGKSLTEINEAVNAKKIEGVIELGRHNFRKEVPESKRGGTFIKTIAVVRSGSGLDTMTGYNEDALSAGSGAPDNTFLRNILGGSLLAVAIAVLALWWFMRKRKIEEVK